MMQSAKRLCSLLVVLCLLVGLVPFGVFATETSDSGVEILCQQLILGDDLTMRFEIAIEESVAEMANVKLAVGGAETVYTVSELTPNENGNYLVSVDVAAAQMTDDITVTVAVGENAVATETYSVLAYAKQILDGSYGTATKALVKEMLNYGAKAQNYFDYKDGSLSEYETVTPVTMPTEAEAMSIEGSVDGIEFYGSSMLFTGKLAIRYYFTAPNGVEGYTFTSGSNTYKADKKNDLYYVDVAGINPQDIDDAVVMTVSNESSSLSVGYGPMNYITRMYNGKGSEKLKNLLQALYGYHLAAEAFVESGETQEEIKELTIPEGSVLVTDYSTAGTPWNNPNWGAGAVGTSNWYEEYDGVAGVQSFGISNESGGYTMWTAVLPDFDFGAYDTVTLRLKVNKDAVNALMLSSDNSEINFIGDIPASNEWTTVTLNLDSIPGFYLRMGFNAGYSGEVLWIDQVWVYDIADELPIPEGAVLVSDFSANPNPWNHPNWGSGAVGISNWYEEYDGVAGVQAFGVNYSADTQFTMWTSVLPLDFDYSSYTYVTIRLKASTDWLLELYLTDLNTDKTFLSEVTANGEWTTVTLNISEIPSWYLKMAAKAHASGELLWIDQVWVSNPEDPEVTEPPVEELAIPDGSVLVTDYSTAGAPWNHPNWGSGAVGISNWYEEYDGVAGVQSFGISSEGGGYTMWTAVLPDFDFGTYDTVTLRLKVNKDAVNALMLSSDNSEINFIGDIPASNEWTTVTLNLDSIPGFYLRMGFNAGYSGEVLWIDQVWVYDIADELAIPEGSVLVTDYSTAGTPWNHPNWGSGAVGISNWYEEYDGVAGVQSFGISSEGGGYTMWTAVLPDFDFGTYDTVTLRLKVNKDAVNALMLSSDNSEINFIGDIPASNEWTTVTLNLESIPGFYLRMGFNAGYSGEVLWIDQVWVYDIADELPIPEGAVLVSDFSASPNPWNNPNWGTGAVGISNWYEEYDGVAGVQAFGVNYSADNQFTMWTNVLPLDFDYSSYTYVTLRLKASKDWLLELYLTDLSTDKTFLSDVAANGEWTTVTLNISEIPSWYLKMAAKAHAGGELLWIDQVWVSNPVEPEITELAIPEGAVLVSDFSASPNPWNNPNWGSGAVGISNWYEEYDGVAGVQAFGVNYSADNQFTMWTNVLPLDFDYSSYTYVTLRLKASKDWLLELYLTDLSTDKTFLSDVAANGEWTTVTLNISEIPSWYLKMATKAHADGELLWIDQVYVHN